MPPAETATSSREAHLALGVYRICYFSCFWLAAESLSHIAFVTELDAAAMLGKPHVVFSHATVGLGQIGGAWPPPMLLSGTQTATGVSSGIDNAEYSVGWQGVNTEEA